MPNPYEAPRAPVADAEAVTVPRPASVTMALIVLWVVLILWLLGTIPHLREIRTSDDPWALSYPVYLVGMIALPAWLLVMIARGRNWARVAAIMVQGVDFLWRLYLLVAIQDASLQLPYLLVPAAVQSGAFLLLYLPRANHWFRFRALR